MKITATEEKPLSARPPEVDVHDAASARRQLVHHPQHTKVKFTRRIALRIGIALIIWGRHPQPQRDWNRLALENAERAARAQREREAQRRWALMGMGMPR